MPWRDTMLRVEGGGVMALQRAFLEDWYFVDRTLLSDRKYYPHGEEHNDCLVQVVTSGPVTPYPEILQGYVRMILNARHYLYIETPYFLPNEPILFALKTVAQAGVDVRLLCPLKSDAHFVEWASRSYLREVMEAGVQVYLYHEQVALRMKDLFLNDQQQSVLLTEVKERMKGTFLIRLWESLTRMLSPLF